MNRVLLWLRKYHTSSGRHDSSASVILPLLPLVISGTAAYIMVMFFFLASGVGYQTLLIQIDDPTEHGDSFELTLTSIDHIANRILFDFEVDRQRGMNEIVKCLKFGSQLSYVGGYRLSDSREIVKMSELPRESLSLEDRPIGSEFTKYRGSGSFHFHRDLRLFPFDKIRWDVSLAGDCWAKSPEIDETPFGVLFVENQIPDYYQSYQGHSSFLLKRNAFLKGLTVVLFLVAFSSSVALIWRARTKPVEMPLLSFFVGLWAVRTILLSPVQADSLRIFPTLVEVTILFFFCFTVVGIGWNRFAAYKSSNEQSG